MRNTSHPTLYRSDIDGLRAVAVMAVVLYHFKTGVFRGGFIGVDVFFVISGFLITGIVCRDIEQGSFSFMKFYERRIRRIFPALFVMIAAVLVAGWIILYPSELSGLAMSLVATLTHTSNFYFFSFKGYFLSDMTMKPLLHTWSLAVEEQFYLVFPIIVFALYRVGRAALVPAMVAIGTVSFFFAAWLVSNSSTTTAFYISPFRFWEMIAGAILAIAKIPEIRDRRIREIVSLAGLGMILSSALAYKAGMPFPGYFALPPVLGTALVIYAGSSGSTLTGKLLSLRPVVFVGLISYSLYLWHWPIAVFSSLKLGRPLHPSDSALLLPFAFICAYLSWRFVEKPFRTADAFSAFRIWQANLSLTALGLSVAAAVVAWAGFPSRFDSETVRIAEYMAYDDTIAYRRGVCFLDGELQSKTDFVWDLCLSIEPRRSHVLLMGDSHGAHWWKGLQSALANVTVMQATSSGCKPLLLGKGVKNCLEFNAEIFASINTLELQSVILAARWRESDLPDLMHTLDFFDKAGIKTFVIGPVPEYPMPLPRLLADVAAGNRSNAEVIPITEIERVDLLYERELAGRTTYLSSYHMICPTESSCKQFTSDGIPLQWDYGHLTEPGSVMMAKSLVTGIH